MSVSVARLTIEELDYLDEVRKYPCLYMVNLSCHKDRTVTTNAWKQISESLKWPFDTTKNKIKTIKSKIRRYITLRKGKSGQGANDVIREDPDYEKQRWIFDHLQKAPTISSLDEQQDEQENRSPPPDIHDLTNTSGQGEDDLLHSSSTSTSTPKRRKNNIPLVSPFKMRQPKNRSRSSPVMKIGSWSSKAKRVSDTEVNKELAGLLKSCRESNNSNESSKDEDAEFCRSLIPYFRRVSRKNKLTAHMKCCEVINGIINSESAPENSKGKKKSTNTEQQDVDTNDVILASPPVQDRRPVKIKKKQQRSSKATLDFSNTGPTPSSSSRTNAPLVDLSRLPPSSAPAGGLPTLPNDPFLLASMGMSQDLFRPLNFQYQQ